MTIHAVIVVARQIEGEVVLIKTEKAFKRAGQADDLMKKLNQEYHVGDKYKPMKMNTEHGEIECFCTAGAFDLELED